MPSVSSEIIAEITDHIRKSGGTFTSWCVGTARDWHSPILVVHQVEEKHDALICREAYTPGGAHAVKGFSGFRNRQLRLRSVRAENSHVLRDEHDNLRYDGDNIVEELDSGDLPPKSAYLLIRYL